MYRIALQAGHQNIQQNCSIPLQTGTGAPGEAQFTVAVRDILSQILQAHGFQLFLNDANGNCDPSFYGQDYDLFMAIHYDSDTYNGVGGGFCGAPDPSVDYATDKSTAIRDVINQTYFPYVGIDLHTERQDGNVSFYYMWQFMSASTPCVLLECGTNNQDQQILNNHQLVATGIAMSICKYFGVPFNTPTPTPSPSTNPGATLQKVHDIVYGNGNSWSKLSQIEKIIPK